MIIPMDGKKIHHENEPKKEEVIVVEKESTTKIDTSHVEKLMNLVSSVRTLIARGMNHEAQSLIIEWLSIEKDNRDLNLLLGQIYEQEWQYEKAEYIYKDMAELHSTDIEILEKLANVLIIEKKNIIANEIYKKIYTFTWNTETTLYMLTHISNTLNDHSNTLLYAKQYVLQWPKNPEIISLLANVQVELWLRKDAIVTYKTLKNLTPYSNEITEILQKLLLEEELSSNFRWKDI
jgi:predicted Zn-dependent protease